MVSVAYTYNASVMSKVNTYVSDDISVLTDGDLMEAFITSERKHEMI